VRYSLSWRRSSVGGRLTLRLLASCWPVVGQLAAAAKETRPSSSAGRAKARERRLGLSASSPKRRRSARHCGRRGGAFLCARSQFAHNAAQPKGRRAHATSAPLALADCHLFACCCARSLCSSLRAFCPALCALAMHCQTGATCHSPLAARHLWLMIIGPAGRQTGGAQEAEIDMQSRGGSLSIWLQVARPQ